MSSESPHEAPNALFMWCVVVTMEKMAPVVVREPFPVIVKLSESRRVNTGLMLGEGCTLKLGRRVLVDGPCSRSSGVINGFFNIVSHKAQFKG